MVVCSMLDVEQLMAPNSLLISSMLEWFGSDIDCSWLIFARPLKWLATFLHCGMPQRFASGAAQVLHVAENKTCDGIGTGNALKNGGLQGNGLKTVLVTAVAELANEKK